MSIEDAVQGVLFCFFAVEWEGRGDVVDAEVAILLVWSFSLLGCDLECWCFVVVVVRGWFVGGVAGGCL